jgi:YgiT-type zinc finger domain-containing protein
MEQQLYQEKTMKCAICKNGTTAKKLITVTFDKNGTTLVFKDVPAQVCDNCGEEYVSDAINSNLLQTARSVLKRKVSLEMLKYAA